MSRELQAHRLGVRPGFPLWCAASLGREVALLAVTLHGPPSLMVHVCLASHTAPLAFLVILPALNTTSIPPAADNLSARADGEDAADERVDSTRRQSRLLRHLQGGGQHRLRREHALTPWEHLQTGLRQRLLPGAPPAAASREPSASAAPWPGTWHVRSGQKKASLILGAGAGENNSLEGVQQLHGSMARLNQNRAWCWVLAWNSTQFAAASRRTSQTDQKSSVLRFISQAALSIRGRNPRPGSPCTQICHVRNSRRDSRAALAWGVLHLAWAVGFRGPCCRALLPSSWASFFYPEFRLVQNYCFLSKDSVRKVLPPSPIHTTSAVR